MIGGRHNNSLAKIAFARRSEKAVNIAFLNPMICRIIFALNGVMFASEGYRNKINPRVVGRNIGKEFFCPVFEC